MLTEHNYLEALISSNIEVHLEKFSQFKVTDSGLYILCPDFDLESITGERYLKVGMTIEQKGLKGRLGAHFSSSSRVKNGKLTSGTVLARHIYNDNTLAEHFKLDFTNQEDRRSFLKNQCYFKVLPLPKFNWENDTQKTVSGRKLKEIESQQIESPLRSKIRYIGSVGVR